MPQAKLLGYAQMVQIDGQTITAQTGTAIVCFGIDVWAEKQGVPAVLAGQAALNAALGGAVTGAQAATGLAALIPSLSSSVLTSIGQAVDEAHSAVTANGGKVSPAALGATVLHLATNTHLLSGNAATWANLAAGLLQAFSGGGASIQASIPL
jgi:hypothetical protein